MDELRYQIDLLHAMNQKLEAKKSMYRMICETASSAFLFFDLKEGTLQTAGNWGGYFDFEVTSVKDLDRIFDEFQEEDELALRELLFLEKKGETNRTADLKRRSGGKWTEVGVRVLLENGAPAYKVIFFSDVTRIMVSNEELKYMAYYDMTTSLYNRNYFVSLVSGMLERAKREGDKLSIMFIDIDNFRKINDGLGLLAGDEVMQAFGQFLATMSKENQVICSHFSSDIFCLAIYDPWGTHSVEYIRDQIRERCKTPFVLTSHQEISLSVSIGVAEYPDASDELLKLINFAEIVMYKAKRKGKSAFQYFDHLILEEFLQNVAMEDRIKSAISRRDFEVFYQPQYATSDISRLRGVEALVRMRNEDGELVSPLKFIAIAEKNETICQIGDIVLEESVRAYAALQKRYGIPFLLSLNISAIQYREPDFTAKLLQILERNQVEPTCVELELTESVFVEDVEKVKEKMDQLHDYGIRVSLDDFGTGYSSLSYLTQMPFDTIKIDKSFVDTVLTDKSSRIIIESIVGLSKKLNFEIVAEGVETKEQLNYLTKIGCENIQGFLLGKPMSERELDNMLLRYSL